jgi:sugar-specific transcriptional regulator TrmB
VPSSIDLTSFGFTPTESLVYEVLLKHGPGTGYALARAAGLARANAYSALEGLVTKGAARVDGGRPRRYRPESPAGLVARISNNHGLALERLSRELDGIAAPSESSVIEIDSGRSILQLLSHDIARSSKSVELLAPPDAFPLLAPALRRPLSAGIPVSLWSTAPITADLGIDVRVVAEQPWPGMPILAVIDERSAIVGSRQGSEVQGYWSSAPSFIAAAGLALEKFRSP